MTDTRELQVLIGQINVELKRKYERLAELAHDKKLCLTAMAAAEELKRKYGSDAESHVGTHDHPQPESDATQNTCPARD